MGKCGESWLGVKVVENRREDLLAIAGWDPFGTLRAVGTPNGPSHLELWGEGCVSSPGGLGLACWLASGRRVGQGSAGLWSTVGGKTCAPWQREPRSVRLTCTVPDPSPHLHSAPLPHHLLFISLGSRPAPTATSKGPSPTPSGLPCLP